MLKTTSKARKQNLGLTVTQATTQARRIVDKVMPGVAATVDSRLSADATTLEPIVITEVTFPKDHPARLSLGIALKVQLTGHRAEMREGDSSFTITRKR